MVSALYHDERRDTLTVRTYTLDHGNPFPVSRLDLLSFTVTFSARNDYYGRDLAYYKAGLVKVIDILVLNTVLSLNILKKTKLAGNLFGILVKGPLIIVSTRKTRF